MSALTVERTALAPRVRSLLARRGPLLVVLAMTVYLAVSARGFLGIANVTASLTQAAPVALVAMGLAIVVIGGGDDVVVGGIDLSIPATAALATAIVSDQLTTYGTPFAVAFALGILVTTVFGLLNAVLVGWVGLSSILATLAVYVAVVGITRVVSGNRRIDVTDPLIVAVRDTRIAGIPLAAVLMLVVAAVLVFVMARTPYGRRLQAVGGNRDAATFAGIPTRRYIMSTFVIAGVVAGLSALLLVARGSGSSPGIDERLMVDMVLATFLGAAFTRRGTVTVFGSVLGAVFVALLSNGLILSRVANAWVDGFKGVLILLVVAAAAARKSEEARA